jgi:hypothetical protein
MMSEFTIAVRGNGGVPGGGEHWTTAISLRQHNPFTLYANTLPI